MLEVDGAGDVVAAGASVPLAVVPAAGSLGEAGVVLLPVEEAAGLAGCSSTGGGAAALWLAVGSLAWVEGVALAPVDGESASVATFTDPAAGTGGAGSAGGNWIISPREADTDGRRACDRRPSASANRRAT